MALCLILIAAPGLSLAGAFDYAVGGGFRTLPRGAAVAADAGYGQLLWGSHTPGGAAELYGFVRPTLHLQTSGVVNRTDVGLDVFPISILGFSASQGYVARQTKTDTLDCDVLECEGTLAKTRLASHLTLGYGALFAYWDLSREAQSLKSGRRTFAFGDESSALAGAAGGDTLWGSDVGAGLKLAGPWSAGALLSTNAMSTSKSNNTLSALFGRWAEGPWSATACLGIYRSSTQTPAFSAGLALSWTGLPSIALR